MVLRRTRWWLSGPQGGSRYPLDTLVDQVEATISLGTRELACRLNAGAKSFDKAAENLAAAAQVVMSRETLRQTVEAEGGRVLAARRRAP